MADKKTTAKKLAYKKTSLNIAEAIWRRAWDYKLDAKKDLGEMVSEALDEYLKKRGA